MVSEFKKMLNLKEVAKKTVFKSSRGKTIAEKRSIDLLSKSQKKKSKQNFGVLVVSKDLRRKRCELGSTLAYPAAYRRGNPIKYF